MQNKSNALLFTSLFLFTATCSTPTQKPDKRDLKAIAKRLATDYQKHQPTQAASLTQNEAETVRQFFVSALQDRYGTVRGYKAGLTSAASQKRFGVERPLFGELLEKMLLTTPALFPVRFGSVPMSEADLIVRVGSEQINTAQTPREALAALDAVIPFLELPDLVYAPGSALTGPALTAINVGARAGVLGAPILLAGGGDWYERLGAFRVELQDGDGRVLATGKGSDLLGHPLLVVLWLRDELKAAGRELKKGDFLSLGSLTKLLPVREAGRIRAVYIGLVPDVRVFVEARFQGE